MRPQLQSQLPSHERPTLLWTELRRRSRSIGVPRFCFASLTDDQRQTAAGQPRIKIGGSKGGLLITRTFVSLCWDGVSKAVNWRSNLRISSTTTVRDVSIIISPFPRLRTKGEGRKRGVSGSVAVAHAQKRLACRFGKSLVWTVKRRHHRVRRPRPSPSFSAALVDA